ncbi:MAG: Na(+)/H(+) antiporter subunit C [Desulfobacteraceae bacterium]|nr:MAG: Na(+)/H(+) antiporter subunit C [Desulfobacteraceae bacterium]
MNLALAATVGILIAVGVFHLLGRDLFRVAFGLYFILNAINLLILSMASLRSRNAPFTQLGDPHSDPMVQAMVLTSIVIGFGLSTFLLLVAARLVRARKSLSSGAIRKWRR